MSHLRIYHASNTRQPYKLLNHFDDIARELAGTGICFSRWQADKQLAADASGQQILAAYNDEIAAFMQQHGHAQADVLSAAVQQGQDCRFMQEHTNCSDVTSLLVSGRVLLGLRHGEEVYLLLCEKGDLVSVPAGIRHWFDLGDNQRPRLIRLFNSVQGLLAQPTGSDIASSYPLLADMS